MEALVSKIVALTARVFPAVVDVSTTINRIILLAYSNLTLAFIVLLFEHGSSVTKKLNRSIVIIAWTVIIVTAGWAYNSYAYVANQEQLQYLSLLEKNHRSTCTCCDLMKINNGSRLEYYERTPTGAK
jgi:hypothetical protein